jgi:hypothetical protein
VGEYVKNTIVIQWLVDPAVHVIHGFLDSVPLTSAATTYSKCEAGPLRLYLSIDNGGSLAVCQPIL